MPRAVGQAGTTPHRRLPGQPAAARGSLCGSTESHAGAFPYFPGDAAVDEMQALLDLGYLSDPMTFVCPAGRETPTTRRVEGRYQLDARHCPTAA